MTDREVRRSWRPAFLTGSRLNEACFHWQIGDCLVRPRRLARAERLFHEAGLAALEAAGDPSRRARVRDLFADLFAPRFSEPPGPSQEPDDEAVAAFHDALNRGDFAAAFDADARRAIERLDSLLRRLIECWDLAPGDRSGLILRLGVDADRLVRPARAWRRLRLPPAPPNASPANGWATLRVPTPGVSEPDACVSHRPADPYAAFQRLRVGPPPRGVHGDYGDEAAWRQVEMTWAAADLPRAESPRPRAAGPRTASPLRPILERLVAFAGAESSTPTAARPHWDGASSLSWAGEIVLACQRSGEVRNAILERFQREGWPRRVEFKRPQDAKPQFAPQQLKNAVRYMNRRMKKRILEFSASPEGPSVTWELLD